MGWDSTRPVPWQRLMREWVIYAGIMAVVFVVFFRDGGIVGAIAGLLISGPLYLALGAVLAKLGYKRASLKELRAARTSGADDADPASTSTSATRGRPAPTRRTASGPARRPAPPRKRRR